MEYLSLGNMVSGSFVACAAGNKRQAIPRRRTSWKMAANELRNPALSAGCAPPITGGKAMLAREARDDAKAVHKEKRCEGGGVNRKNALNDRERIIGVAAR